MNRLLLCIGCNEYNNSKFIPLTLAISDAQRIFTLLTDPKYGEYNPTNSVLITNPTITEIRSTLQKVLFNYGPIDVFTLFFAGHGMVKDGSYYLCAKDTDIASLSMSACGASDIFKAINEARPRQSNIIIDACQSGGVVNDIGSLLKSEIIGEASTSAITVFSAAASDQTANENASGGISTSELIQYIIGDKLIQNIRPYLDLAEIGRATSSAIQTQRSQAPNVWGLNLYGDALFTKNQNFTGDELNFSYALAKAPAQSDIGQLIQRKAKPLWNVYAELSSDTDNQKLFDILRSVCNEVANANNYASSFISGIFPNLVSEAAKSDDVFAPSQVLAVCISVLLEYTEIEPAASSTINLLIAEWLKENRLAFTKLKDISLATPYGLLSETAGISDLYYLPLRLFKILGWRSAHIIIGKNLGLDLEEDTKVAEEIIAKILQDYSPSIVAMNDIQAPYLLLFYKACQQLNLIEQAELVFGLIFNDFVAKEGKIADANLDAERVLQYMLCRSANDFSSFYSSVANPSSLLSVILIGANIFNIQDVVDPYLHRLDHVNFNLFVSHNHRQFGLPVMRGGVNFTFQIGHEIWTVADFITAYNSRVDIELNKDNALNEVAVRIACILSSVILPNRLALFV